MYLCVCDEKSKLLIWTIRPILSDQVTNIIIYNLLSWFIVGMKKVMGVKHEVNLAKKISQNFQKVAMELKKKF